MISFGIAERQIEGSLEEDGSQILVSEHTTTTTVTQPATVEETQEALALLEADLDRVFLHQVVQGIRLACKETSLPESAYKSVQSKNSEEGLTTAKYQLQGRGNSAAVELKIFGPDLFSQIRSINQVSDEHYLAAWNYKLNELPKMKQGAGRSGSLFLYSKDNRFLVKTIPYLEVQTLRTILPSYLKHLRDSPDSKLMRFYGLHRFYHKGTYTYLIVANNIFYLPHHSRIHYKYDLKGRKPKKGKFLRHKAEDPTNYVFKDNDLDRNFYFDNEVCDLLLESLHKDVEFLTQQNCMDYSLLIGIHNLDRQDALSSSSSFSTIANVTRSRSHSNPDFSIETNTPNSSIPEQKTKPISPRNGSVNNNTPIQAPVIQVNGVDEPSLDPPKDSSKDVDFRPFLLLPAEDACFVRSVPGDPFSREIFLIGIIDFLSRYTSKKVAAHFIKSFKWSDDSLSTVRPEYYSQRFMTFVRDIILPSTSRPAGAPVEISKSSSSLI